MTPGLASAAGSNSVSAPAAAGGVGVLARLHPHHPDTGGGVQVEVDRAGLLDALGGDGGHRVRVGVVPGFVGAGLADDPPFVDGEEAAQGLVERRMGLSACWDSASGDADPDRSKRLPAMIRIPGPSQVSRARATSVVTAEVVGVASGVRSRSLTTMTLRPRGTSTRVTPGSGEKVPASAPGSRPSGPTSSNGCAFAVTALPS